jgi:hypothetical protein
MKLQPKGSYDRNMLRGESVSGIASPWRTHRAHAIHPSGLDDFQSRNTTETVATERAKLFRCQGVVGSRTGLLFILLACTLFITVETMKTTWQ